MPRSTKLPGPPLEQQAVVALRRTSDALRRRFEQAIQPAGVTGQQYNILRILRGAADGGEGPLPTMIVADRMIEQEPGISRLMGRLERKGLLHRTPGADDSRKKLCELTAAGRRLVDSLDDVVAATNRQVLANLDEGQVVELISLLDAVRRAASPEPSAASP